MCIYIYIYIYICTYIDIFPILMANYPKRIFPIQGAASLCLGLQHVVTMGVPPNGFHPIFFSVESLQTLRHQGPCGRTESCNSCTTERLDVFTLPETNIAPENGWLEYYFPIGMANF